MAGLVLSLGGVLAAAGLVVGRPHEAGRAAEADHRPVTSRDDDGRESAAKALVERLAARLAHGSRQRLVALAAPGDERAARELTTLRHNVRVLGVSDLSMRYVGEDARGPGAALRQALGDEGWVADVQLRWRLRGFDARDSLMELPVTLRVDADRAWFVTARDRGRHAIPLWVQARVWTRQTPQSLVVTTRGHPAARLSALADQAVVDVRKVLRHWRGRLVVEVPADQDALGRVLGSTPGAYSGIAAVTTTVDRSVAPRAPVHIFVNPRVFDPLGARGAQIVMSHEATHVATGAARSSMPTWLLEGFADYVALDHVDLPVSVTASQILAAVRRHEAPRRLPGRADFDARNTALGASYESAWLACRLLAARYGERRLLVFYRAADRASSTTRPFRTVLGTTQQAFTQAWRRDLRRLAG